MTVPGTYKGSQEMSKINMLIRTFGFSLKQAAVLSLFDIWKAEILL